MALVGFKINSIQRVKCVHNQVPMWEWEILV